MLKFNHFKTLLQELKIFNDYMPIMQSNGFDDWETVSELNEELLNQIGIANPIIIKEILSCVRSAESYQIDLQGDQEKKVVLDKKMLRRGIFMKNEKHLPEEKFFLTLVNMVLNDRSIEKISSDINFCRHLNNLQLANNRIEKIEHFSNLRELKILRLENNFISKLENMENLKNLEILHISQNCIFRLEGLQFCPKLREIYISDQKLSKKLGFEFEEQTMKSLGSSLLILEVERNHMKNIQNLEYLLSLKVLRLGGNQIESIERMDKQLYCMGSLQSLDLRNNPITKISKYRDQIIMITHEGLEELDDKNILPKEREFILKFYNIDNARGPKKKGKNENKQNFEISGSEIKGWNHIERIFAEEDSKHESTEEHLPPLQINRGLNNANTFTKKVFENTKHIPIYSKKQTY